MTAKLILATLVALSLVGFVPTFAAAEGPCPSNCTPPEPCGWAPDIRKDTDGWVLFYVECARDLP